MYTTPWHGKTTRSIRSPPVSLKTHVFASAARLSSSRTTGTVTDQPPAADYHETTRSPVLRICCLQRILVTLSGSLMSHKAAYLWPDASSNGYAFFHRVDKVNGGDANPTHTTGFGRAGAFWYK
eukprot:CAMPEP_0169484208 /NCGR_PEP_ID=MMETSP1042-20121227/31619_1 /TAXON_ID=464988 /ORGANISM="Hemiselmis andersenii, Strain CCMP1180" /LENGTH=123 /DNA_ID=CAMNT_0009599193 /DNA_START=96 /DNA_END=468 /DNA_ORIENTATION=-